LVETLDDAAEHVGRLPGDLSRTAAATHIGLFFAWALERELLSDRHVSGYAAELDKVRRGWWSGRDYILQVCGGRLTDEDLSAIGRGFARAYYATGRYLSEYAERLGAGRPSRYHVRDAPETQREVVALLDQRFAEWKAEPKAAVAVPPPRPEPPGRSAPAPTPPVEPTRLPLEVGPPLAPKPDVVTPGRDLQAERGGAAPPPPPSSSRIVLRGPSRAERWRRLWAQHRALSGPSEPGTRRPWRSGSAGGPVSGKGFGIGIGLFLLVVMSAVAQCRESRKEERRRRPDPYRVPRLIQDRPDKVEFGSDPR